jgi:uncharacterized protein YkwD
MKAILFFSVLFLFQGSSINYLHEGPGACLSSEEKKLYDLIMTYRQSKGLSVIPISEKLTRTAQAHTHDLADNYKFKFDNTCNPHSWSSKGKWSSCCYTSDHKKAKCMWDKPKEIADYTNAGYEIAYYSSDGASPQEALDGWKLSAGHNPLLINDGMWSKVQWKAIGLGIYKEYGVVWFGQDEDAVTSNLCESSN